MAPGSKTVRERPPEVARAWTALLTNLLVLPGLGSLMVRRRSSGILQVALSMAGLGLMLVWLFSFVQLWAAEGSFPAGTGPHFSRALLGLLLGALGWLWAAASGLAAVRQAEAAHAAAADPGRA